MSVSTSASATLHSELTLFAGAHRVFADEIDQLRLVSVHTDKVERVRGLGRNLFGDAFEQLASLCGCEAADCRDQFVNLVRCHAASVPHPRDQAQDELDAEP